MLIVDLVQLQMLLKKRMNRSFNDVLALVDSSSMNLTFFFRTLRLPFFSKLLLFIHDFWTITSFGNSFLWTTFSHTVLILTESSSLLDLISFFVICLQSTFSGRVCALLICIWFSNSVFERITKLVSITLTIECIHNTMRYWVVLYCDADNLRLGDASATSWRCFKCRLLGHI